ncbi:MAG: hypothetical protein OEY67_08525 [Gammaproteobacteria bacterium]|nr:hypothetical protein [Gammaproteobacteria bacterium]
MNKCYSTILVLVAFGIANNDVYGYERKTHRELSIKTVDLSVLPNHINNLGLSSIKQLLIGKSNACSLEKQLTAYDWIHKGSWHEDDTLNDNCAFVARYKNHFYNPITAKGLDANFTGSPSPSWGLEDAENFGGDQEYSYKDFMDYLYLGLIDESNLEREKYLARAFRTIGHIIHLIQDAGQPQHTRNDSHGGIPFAGEKSLYEDYSQRRDILAKIRNIGKQDITIITFSEPRSYWHTDIGEASINAGKGLTEYSNRNFVTQGTNFRGSPGLISTHPEFPSPSPVTTRTYPITDSLLLGPVGTERNSTLTGDITFVETRVFDAYNGSVDTNTRSSSYSLFDADLEKSGHKKVFALNKFNFDMAHEFLFKKIISYSVGFINHTFRGRLEISLPEEGVYSIVDHAVTKQKDTQGFTQINLKIKNVTPDIIESNGVAYPQHMAGGKLVAVAKFKRNLCYEPNLRGEFEYRTDGTRTWNSTGDDHCTNQTYRSEEEDIVVSEPVLQFDLPAGAEPAPVSFTFQTPIPINATDLYLQVVYRGALGAEADAVVVTTKDIFEPTYFTYFNGTDYFIIDDVIRTYDEIKVEGSYIWEHIPKSTRSSIDPLHLKNYQFWFKPGYPVVRFDYLAPGTYIRVAYLTDQSKSYVRYTGKGYLDTWYQQGQEALGLLVNSGAYPGSKVNQGEVGNHTGSEVDKARTQSYYYWFQDYLIQHFNIDQDASYQLPKEQLQEQLYPLTAAVEADPKPVAICFFTEEQKKQYQANPDTLPEDCKDAAQ